MSKNSETKDLMVQIKVSALRTQYNRGLDMYFNCLERIDEIKKYSDVTLDKADLSRAKSQKYYYSKMNKELDGFISANQTFVEKTIQ